MYLLYGAKGKNTIALGPMCLCVLNKCWMRFSVVNGAAARVIFKHNPIKVEDIKWLSFIFGSEVAWSGKNMQNDKLLWSIKC